MDKSQYINKFYAAKNQILARILHDFYQRNSLLIKIGVELEFYLLDTNFNSVTNNENHIANLGAIINEKIEAEKGAGQLEIKFAHSENIISLCEKISATKNLLQDYAKRHDLQISFAAQPFADDCGSALQFNFSLHDFAADVDADENPTTALIHAMLDSIDLAIIFYAPNIDDYKRFDLELNRKLYRAGKFSAPVNSSFGDNNRTTAIRITKSDDDIMRKRIEFRIPSANSDPSLGIAALIVAFEKSLNEKSRPQESQKIFGNAFDGQYFLKEIPQNFNTALDNFFAANNYIRDAFEEVIF